MKRGTKWRKCCILLATLVAIASAFLTFPFVGNGLSPSVSFGLSFVVAGIAIASQWEW